MATLLGPACHAAPISLNRDHIAAALPSGSWGLLDVAGRCSYAQPGEWRKDEEQHPNGGIQHAIFHTDLSGGVGNDGEVDGDVVLACAGCSLPQLQLLSRYDAARPHEIYVLHSVLS